MESTPIIPIFYKTLSLFSPLPLSHRKRCDSHPHPSSQKHSQNGFETRTAYEPYEFEFSVEPSNCTCRGGACSSRSCVCVNPLIFGRTKALPYDAFVHFNICVCPHNCVHLFPYIFFISSSEIFPCSRSKSSMSIRI